jgi:hypothetical protein
MYEVFILCLHLYTCGDSDLYLKQKIHEFSYKMSSDEESFMFLNACTLLLVKSRQRKRMWWQHEFLMRRETHGAYAMLTNELTLQDGACLNSYVRMVVADFENLLQLVTSHILNITKFRESIPSADRLAVRLRFLAMVTPSPH